MQEPASPPKAPPTEVSEAAEFLEKAMQIPPWLPAPMQDALGKLGGHPWLQALLVIVFFFLLAKAAQWLLGRVAVSLTGRTRTSLDDKILEQLRRPIFLSVFFLGLGMGLGVLSKGLGFPEKLTLTSQSLVVTVLILVWLRAGFRIFRLVLESLGRHHESFPLVEERTIPLFDIVGKLVLLGGASYVALLIWGIDPTAWLASAGVLGIAVGFAAKDTLANLFGGFFIVADAPYKIGDFIVLGTGERGQVTHVGIRSTRVLTRDDIEITVPNLLMANSKIINESGGRWENERIRIKVGAAYGSDVDQVCEVLVAVAKENEHVNPSPAPRVRLRAFGESSLDFELLCWIDEPVLRGRLSHELYVAVYKAFGKAGIEIPYPKRDVYLHSQGQDS